MAGFGFGAGMDSGGSNMLILTLLLTGSRELFLGRSLAILPRIELFGLVKRSYSQSCPRSHPTQQTSPSSEFPSFSEKQKQSVFFSKQRSNNYKDVYLSLLNALFKHLPWSSEGRYN